mmetsp:Transcript_31910/g.79891  ORF Transcript_31910/g.79891 Transcript_31910/m.79891 type:complete len:221 (-) Transcript_31910:53-715(-)
MLCAHRRLTAVYGARLHSVLHLPILARALHLVLLRNLLAADVLLWHPRLQPGLHRPHGSLWDDLDPGRHLNVVAPHPCVRPLQVHLHAARLVVDRHVVAFPEVAVCRTVAVQAPPRVAAGLGRQLIQPVDEEAEAKGGDDDGGARHQHSHPLRPRGAHGSAAQEALALHKRRPHGRLVQLLQREVDAVADAAGSVRHGREVLPGGRLERDGRHVVGQAPL